MSHPVQASGRRERGFGRRLWVQCGDLMRRRRAIDGSWCFLALHSGASSRKRTPRARECHGVPRRVAVGRGLRRSRVRARCRTPRGGRGPGSRTGIRRSGRTRPPRGPPPDTPARFDVTGREVGHAGDDVHGPRDWNSGSGGRPLSRRSRTRCTLVSQAGGLLLLSDAVVSRDVPDRLRFEAEIEFRMPLPVRTPPRTQPRTRLPATPM
jgi:hypothetical protein